jgi:hypothetical protein
VENLESLNLKSLSDEELVALHASTKTAVESRRKIQLEDIRPGMKPEDVKRAKDAIAEALKNR